MAIKKYETLTDWAVVVDATYNIRKRGVSNHGFLLYGRPSPDDWVSWMGSKGFERVRGVEMFVAFTDPDRHYPGIDIGIVLDVAVPVGTCLLGRKMRD
jgi:hypothetical protein